MTKKIAPATAFADVSSSNGAATVAHDLLQRAAGLHGALLTAAAAAVATGTIDPTMMREAAGVVRASATLAGELRAREKQAASIVGRLTIAIIVAWARQQSESTRARLRYALNEAEETASGAGSVLG